MSIVSFLSAVGLPRSVGGKKLSDLEYINTQQYLNRVTRLSGVINTLGDTLEYTVPEGKDAYIIVAKITPTDGDANQNHTGAKLFVGDAEIDVASTGTSRQQTTNAGGRYAYGSGHGSLDNGMFHAAIGVKALAEEVIKIENINSDGLATAQLVLLLLDTGSSPLLQPDDLPTPTAQVPSPPLNVQASETAVDTISLTWDIPTNNGGTPIIDYRIMQSENADMSDAETVVTGLLVRTHEVTGLADNTTYYYSVEARNSVGYSNLSNIASATTEIDHPATVGNVRTVRRSASAIRLLWNAVTDTGGVPLQGYRIQRSTSPNSGFTNLVADTDNLNTRYDDTNLASDATYYYRIKAINTDDKESLQWSSVASLSITYDAPTNLTSVLASDSTSVTIFWDESTDLAGATITGHRIERSIDNITFMDIDADTNNIRNNYTDNTIEGGTTYYYRVSTIANSITGPASDSITVTVPNHNPSAPQTLAAVAAGSSSIDLSWLAPLSTGGIPLTDYTLERSKSVGFPDGSGTAQTVTKTNSPSTAINGITEVQNTITITAAESFVIDHIQVILNITHTYRGDLQISLLAPNGNTYTLKDVDFSDNAQNVIATFEGTLFNELIGTNSAGAWILKVNDRYSELDDGTLNSWTLNVIRATEPVVRQTIAEGTLTHTDTGLDAETQYFYRVRTRNASGTSAYSNIVNETTNPNIYGSASDGDLTVAAGETVDVTTNKNYENLTIEDGGVLRCSNVIIKVNGAYNENDTGKIVVLPTGCEGGDAGISVAGIGGRDIYSGRSVTIRTDRGQTAAAQTPPVPAVLTPPTIAASCTSLDVFTAQSLLILQNIFTINFANQINGGMGSDGTPAQPSGNGGAVGTRHTYNGSAPGYLLAGGGNGGNGGLAAQGVDGVRGGGKFAMFVRNITENITIEAKGINGNDGLQGTGAEGTDGVNGGSNSRGNGTRGGDGQDATVNGTLGSEGSQGGLVYLLYGQGTQMAVEGTTSFSDDFVDGVNGWTYYGSTDYDIGHFPTGHNGTGMIDIDSDINQPLQGGIEAGVTKTFSLEHIDLTQDVNWSHEYFISAHSTANHDAENATNSSIRFSNADTDEELFLVQYVSQEGGNIGWEFYTKELKDLLAGVENLKVEIFLITEIAGNDILNQRNRLDNMSLSFSTLQSGMRVAPEVEPDNLQTPAFRTWFNTWMTSYAAYNGIIEPTETQLDIIEATQTRAVILSSIAEFQRLHDLILTNNPSNPPEVVEYQLMASTYIARLQTEYDRTEPTVVPSTTDITVNVDVSGGIGGFNGADSTADAALLTTKADDGEDGYVFTSIQSNV